MNRKRLALTIILISLMCAGCRHTPESDQRIIFTYVAETIVAVSSQTASAWTPTSTVTPTSTETPTPKPTSTFTSIPTVAGPVNTATSDYVFPDKAQFVSFSPALNSFTPGQTFTLTCQIQNTGTSTWSGKYSFYHKDGTSISASSIPIDTVVPPQGVLTLSFQVTAPSAAGSYQTTFALSNPNGIEFYYVYYTVNVGDTTSATPTATNTGEATATPDSLSWMCSDFERSIAYGDGCEAFCTTYGESLRTSGTDCYSRGALLN